MIVDLSGLRFADSSLMIDLACLAQRLRAQGMTLWLAHPQPNIRMLIETVGLHRLPAVRIDGGRIEVTYTLTTPACPIGPQVAEQMQEFIGEIPGVEEVVPTMVFSPPWTPDKMSEDAKFALGY